MTAPIVVYRLVGEEDLHLLYQQPALARQETVRSRDRGPLGASVLKVYANKGGRVLIVSARPPSFPVANVIRTVEDIQD